MCQDGPLSLIGPPCLLSPDRYCVSTTRAFSVQGGREGGEEEGERERGGKERERGESKCRSAAAVPKRRVFSFFFYGIFGCHVGGVFVRARVGMQQSAVKVLLIYIFIYMYCVNNIGGYGRF